MDRMCTDDILHKYFDSYGRFPTSKDSLDNLLTEVNEACSLVDEPLYDKTKLLKRFKRYVSI